MKLDRYRSDPAAFIDRFIPLNEKGKAWKLAPYQRRVLALAFAIVLRLLLWGEPKKSGKTLLLAAITAWWAFTRPDTEIIIAANDLEQSQGRVFKTLVKLIRNNPELEKSAKIRQSSIELSNGTTITAIPNDYKGEAGSRHSLVVYDEYWGYSSESSLRLIDELTPPPTEPDAWVLIGTYAGFIGESVALERLYQRGLAGTRIDAELEVYREGDMTMFWSHTPRQTWQTPSYYAEQKKSLRTNAYLRLHENRWVTGAETFITEELWDQNVNVDLRPALKWVPGVYVGVDAGIKGDNAAGVALAWIDDRLSLVAHRIWRPSKADPLDIEQTIEVWLDELCSRMNVRRILCDPYQLHRTITSMRRAGKPIEEFAQTNANLTAMGQNLFELLRGRNIDLYESDELRAQALNTVALESARGWRIAKEKTNRKIDAMVAMAMAAHAAVNGRRHATGYGEMNVPWIN